MTITNNCKFEVGKISLLELFSFHTAVKQFQKGDCINKNKNILKLLVIK